MDSFNKRVARGPTPMSAIKSPSSAGASSSASSQPRPPDRGTPGRYRVVWLGLLVLGIVGLAWWNTSEHLASNPSTSKPTPASASSPASSASASAAAHVTQILQPPPIGPTTPDTSATLTAALTDLEAFLSQPHSKNDIANALERLRTRLMHAPRAVADAAIYGYLATGHNASTTLGFDIGPGGWLKNAPSLRAFLLDALGEVDPQSAADYAKVILEQNNVSPDEWALSLRNLSQHDPSMATDPYLQEKTRELVTNQQWLSQPSQGLLEGFDFVVFTKQTNLAPVLVSYMIDSNQSPAVRYASFLTLDRLTLDNPASVLDLMNQQPQLLSDSTPYRAGLFARADVTDPAQLAAVESYLQRSDVSAAEIGQFANAFPLFSEGVGDNLATTQVLPTLQQIAQRDVATLAVVNQWLDDPRFAARQNELQQLQANLIQNVASARQGGLLPKAP